MLEIITLTQASHEKGWEHDFSNRDGGTQKGHSEMTLRGFLSSIGDYLKTTTTLFPSHRQ